MLANQRSRVRIFKNKARQQMLIRQIAEQICGQLVDNMRTTRRWLKT
jgi:hypothetical protein